MGEFWDITPNMDFEPGKSKWLAKGKLKELTHKSNSNCLRVWLSLSLSLSLSLGAYPRESIHSLHIPFPPNKYFTCFTTFHLHGNFLLQSRRARALSLITGRVARIWCSHHQDPTSSLAGEPKPCLKLHRTKPSEIITMAMFKTKKLQEKLGK